MASKYSPVSTERETTIVFNEAESQAAIYTHNRALIRRLELHKQDPEYAALIIEVEKNESYSKYLIPKAWVKVRLPRKSSAELKQKRAEIARANFALQEGE